MGCLLFVTACSPGARDFGKGPPLKPAADPSAVIAAELAFSQLAQTKGQWTAFLETAAPGAEMFAPQRVKAADWLRGRANPPVSVKWQPHAVWSSCDGSYAVTRGAWERPGSAGSYVTVWQRQKNGRYKWQVDMSLVDEPPLPSPEMVAARVADCGKSRRQRDALSAMEAETWALDAKGDRETALGVAEDGTLVWETRAESGKRHIAVKFWNGQKFDTVVDTSVTPHGP